MLGTGIERPHAPVWRACEHCIIRFLSKRDNPYHSPACRLAATKGELHPDKLDFLLSDIRRLRHVSKDARDTTHLWAWRRLLELRGLIRLAPDRKQAPMWSAAFEALLEGSGFAAEGKRLVAEQRARWQEMHDRAEADIAAGTLKAWPEGLKEYPYQELPGAE